ncbi:MAG: hypothetical protein AB8D78_11320 [Akkermansiaceae bacterium]
MDITFRGLFSVGCRIISAQQRLFGRCWNRRRFWGFFDFGGFCDEWSSALPSLHDATSTESAVFKAPDCEEAVQ